MVYASQNIGLEIFGLRVQASAPRWLFRLRVNDASLRISGLPFLRISLRVMGLTAYHRSKTPLYSQGVTCIIAAVKRIADESMK